MRRFLLSVMTMVFLCCPEVASAQQGGETTLETVIWLDVRDSGNPAFVREYIRLYPEGGHVAEARELLAVLATTLPANVRPLRPGNEDTPGTVHQGGDGQSGTAARPEPNEEWLASGESLAVLQEQPPPVQHVECQKRFEQAEQGDGQLLCATFMTSANFTFARDCGPQSYGFAGVSVSQQVFLSAGETLLLRESAAGMIQVTGDRPQCFLLVGERPQELRKYRHLVLDTWEREVRICDLDGNCR